MAMVKVAQEGTENEAHVNQKSGSGSPQRISIVQEDGNTIMVATDEIEEEPASNHAHITQTGNGNRAVIQQTGKGNRVSISQNNNK